MHGLSFIERLSTNQVQEVIDDLTLMADDATIIFAVDSHEIIDFCFPVSMDDPEPLTPEALDYLADSQASLYHALFQRSVRPVLLPDYAAELFGYYRYIERTVSDVNRDTKLTDSLVAQVQSSNLGTHWQTPDKLVRWSARHFNTFLLVALGIASIGIRRFRQLLSARLAPLDEADPVADARLVLRAAGAAYSESALINVMVRELDASTPPEIRERETRLERERRRRSNITDARAVDRVLFINTELERAFRRKELSRRYLVLYLSSAARTARLFRIPEVVDALPEISSRKYPVWRTRDQLFAHVTNRSDDGDRKVRATEGAEKLNVVKATLGAVHEARASLTNDRLTACDSCVRTSGPGSDCAIRNLCQAIADFERTVQDRGNMAENLGLLSSVRQYDRLRSTRSKSRHSYHLDVFRDLASIPNIEKIAEEQQRLQHEILQARSVYSRLAAHMLSEEAEKDPAVEKDDLVVGTAQALPIHLRIEDSKVEAIRQLVADSYSHSETVRAVQRQSLRAASTELFRLDGQAVDDAKTEAQQELVRCLLLAALPGSEGDTIAYEHAVEIFPRYPDWDREFLYVLVWLARRNRDYVAGDTYAAIASQRFPEDARFCHGRALNTYAWTVDAKTPMPCRRSLSDALHDLERALSLVEQHTVPETRLPADVLAVLLNDIAYIRVLDISDASYDVVVARVALNRMKLCFEREGWLPRYPEYFHTEATVEYHEFLAARKSHVPLKDLLTKLGHAETAAVNALALAPNHEAYRALTESIRREASGLRTAAH